MALPASTRALRLGIVAAALFGVLVVTHLTLQAQNDFAFGCSGVAGADLSVASTPASGCADVTSSAWGSLFGVPLTVFGFVFYGLMVLLRLAYVVRRDDRLRLAAFALAGAGVAYSAFLTGVQFTQFEQRCWLCLLSALTTLVLFLLHVIEHRRLRAAAAAPARPVRGEPAGLAALRPYAPLLGLFVLLLGADVVLARSGADRAAATETAGTPPSLSAGASGTASPGTPGETPPPAGGAACSYDPAIAPIADTSPFTNGPFLGTADAPVEIVEIFDPNCPHCKDMMAVLEPVIEANAARVRFYPVAYPLRTESVLQVIALTLAQREGKYFELIEEMFRRQDQSWGMTLPEVEAAVQAVGINPAGIRGLAQDQARLAPMLEAIQAQAATVGTAFATADGGISVPKVAINGRVIASTYESYSPTCLQQFIDDAAGA